MRSADALDKSGIRSRQFKPKNSLVQIRVRGQRYSSSRRHIRFGDLSHSLKYLGHTKKRIEVYFVYDANQVRTI